MTQAAAPGSGVAARDVVVIGAGIVGLACAQKLRAAGREVTVIERGGVAEGASFGNAGAFAFSDILPMATSGMLRRVPKWLLDPLGPLSIPPAYFLTVLPWLVRFWRAGWADRVERSVAAQSALMRLAASEMRAMVAACGLGRMVRSDGSLELYESEAELARAEPGWRARAAEGIGFEHVRGARLAALQPGLSAQFVAGTFVAEWQTVADPYLFALALAEWLRRDGVGFMTGEAVAVVPEEGGGARVQLAGGGAVRAAAVVIAAGAWSKRLVAPLGDRVPLETERGYNTTLPEGAFDLRRQVIFGGHGFVVTPLSTGIRVGGAVELGGLELPANFARAEAMLAKAKRFLPGLATGGGRQWMGFRPSLPDSLPAIGASRASPAIVYAFGHGHLGLTQSAATGRLVADLVGGAQPAIDLTPFRPQRFH